MSERALNILSYLTSAVAELAEVREADLTADTPLSEAGIESLDLTLLTFQVEQTFQVNLTKNPPPGENKATLGVIAAHIASLTA